MYCQFFCVLVCMLFLLLLSSSLGSILFFWRSQVVGCRLLVWQKKGVAFWDRVAEVEVLLYLQHQRSSKGEEKRKIKESARGGTGRRQCGRGKKSSAAVLEAQSAALFNTFWHCRLSKSLIRRHGVPPPLTEAWRRDGTWTRASLYSTRQRRLAARQIRGQAAHL